VRQPASAVLLLVALLAAARDAHPPLAKRSQACCASSHSHRGTRRCARGTPPRQKRTRAWQRAARRPRGTLFPRSLANRERIARTRAQFARCVCSGALCVSHPSCCAARAMRQVFVSTTTQRPLQPCALALPYHRSSLWLWQQWEQGTHWLAPWFAQAPRLPPHRLNDLATDTWGGVGWGGGALLQAHWDIDPVSDKQWAAMAPAWPGGSGTSYRLSRFSPSLATETQTIRAEQAHHDRSYTPHTKETHHTYTPHHP
jgi:hypothetical protein